ncbi:MAG TPA: hypothetical protein VKU01_07580 [Bryobacteraceae bacterium]|nr:hypothetical protein [Bryobacteraceae bacterium]
MIRTALTRACIFACVAGFLVAPSPAQDAATDMAHLKAQLADQQSQIQELRRALEEQKKLLQETIASRSTENAKDEAKPVDARTARVSGYGEVASTRPILPPGVAPIPSAVVNTTLAPPVISAQGGQTDSAPLQLKIGNAYITPVGFMDMTSVSRSTNTGSGIGTNFGSVPYGNTQAGALTETRLSIQNSRLGARFDSMFGNTKVLGYWESDFLGQLGAPPNGGLAVSSNPYVFRMRLYWVDVQRNNWEFLAGQSWSLMTPNRKGVSPLPGDIFFSQDVDVNYQLGLTWGRIPGFRGAYHWGNKAALAVALENSEPYVGGGNGGSASVLPAAISGTANAVSGAVLGGQINNGNSQIQAASVHPDIIAKLALDPSSKFHFEITGVEITNKIAFPGSTPPFAHFTKAGGGGSINMNFELVKGLRFITNNYWSSGGGRYIFGQAPDFIIRGDGSLSLVHSASTVTGLEATIGKTLYYGYYGGVYISRNLALDANGKTLIGYGPISNDGQNRAIQEVTFGTNTTLAKDAKWGALNLMFQFSWLQRNPWLVTGTAPGNAHLEMGFVNLRYTLPGSAPTLK